MPDTEPRFDTLILGLGKTGWSCVNYLAGLGETLAVADSRPAPPQLASLRQDYPQVPFFAGDFRFDLLCRARRLLLSPGIAPSHPAIRAAARAGVEIVGDVEIFCRNVDAPLIAVTGSNGKSTVVSLLAQMLERAGRRVGLGGNVGIPALDLLSAPAPDYYLLELSSFQLETLRSHRPVAAAVLNVSADHLDRYQDLRDYARVKENVYAGAGAMIINLDDETVRAMEQAGRRVITWSLTRPEADFCLCERQGESWLAQRNKPLLRQSELKLHGLHNVANSLACLALGHALDVPMAAMLEALRAFGGLPHRCEWVAGSNGVNWYNDSKGTNVGATLAALRGLFDRRGNILLIAGGDGKGADFSPLRKALRKHVKAAILIGRSAPDLAAVTPHRDALFYATGMEAAVAVAARLAQAGDTVLLSPACASFDMFRDFAERGDVFKRAVADLVAGDGACSSFPPRASGQTAGRRRYVNDGNEE